ncbi:hypothetical protein MWU78_14245 [Arenibacter sp. F26102]|uniref:Heavy-metal-associated domain-containing protein n=1 Tax=Arenibacter arenosicollis TaxID=2762274 RepID=A0ABR7QI36_9FLAO|nr:MULTISPECIES: hypothetical protein [Arenibacter]MBC8766754.1 hypothetical protein [Arenibacter arenosicollis]MCK0146814.1 hypothetical protein [Arenibacter sp. F26102]
MKAIAKIGNLISESDKRVILRNLSRIMDIRIINLEVDTGRLIFFYYSPIALEQVKQELWRIGYPIRHFKFLSTLSPNMQNEGRGETTLA